MSGNVQRVLALMVGALTSAFVALGWGVILYALGEPVIDCVKDGAAAGGGTFVVCLAVIVLFPFKSGPDAGMLPPPASAPPRTPSI
ncbi:hypothetical protein [Streptomyces mirabilis]|uniref:hypothetical protein n=1 Tax=Streptomyces mirabilis TaxID=68239 RepID=UPI0036A3A49E